VERLEGKVIAGFLNALSFITPVAQTLGPEMQIGAREAQRQSSEAAFDKLLDDAGGPELDPFRAYRKAGATPAQTTSAMSGDIGKAIQQKYAVHRMSEIMGGPDFKQNLITAAGEGLVPWKDVLTYMKDPTKAPPVMPEDLKSNAQQWLDSGPNIPDQTRRYVQGAIDSNNYGALKEINDKVIPPYQGSTMYATRGFTMTGVDNAGVPFQTRYVEPSRGGPAHVQSVYGDGTPVPPEKMRGARYTGGFADDGGGGGAFAPAGADYGGAPPPGGPEKPAGGPSGAPPADGGGDGIPAAPSSGAAGTGGFQPLKVLHPGASNEKTIGQIQALLPQIRHLQTDMQAIGQEKWDRDSAPQRVLDKWLAQKFDYLPGTDSKAAGNFEAQKFLANEAKNDPDYQKLIKDPDLAYTMSELITTDAVASITLMASSGSRAQSLLEAFKGHIMEPNGNFGSIMTNIATLDAVDGPYRSTLRAFGVTRPATAPPADISPAGRAARRGSSTAPSSASSATSKMNKEDEDFMSRYYRK
jgi:hypothetical protein